MAVRATARRACPRSNASPNARGGATCRCPEVRDRAQQLARAGRPAGPVLGAQNNVRIPVIDVSRRQPGHTESAIGSPTSDEMRVPELAASRSAHGCHQTPATRAVFAVPPHDEGGQP
jgi:hypothetical protein